MFKLGTKAFMFIQPQLDKERYISVRKGQCCRNDGEIFEGKPYFLPTGRKKDGKIEVNQIFCSPACRRRFILDQGFGKKGLLSELSSMDNEDNHEIAPPLDMLKKFNPMNIGMTIQEYRESSKSNVVSSICDHSIMPYDYVQCLIFKKDSKSFEQVNEDTPLSNLMKIHGELPINIKMPIIPIEPEEKKVASRPNKRKRNQEEQVSTISQFIKPVEIAEQEEESEEEPEEETQ